MTDSVTAKVTAGTVGSAERDGLDGKNALLPAETQQPEKQPQTEEAIPESQPTVEEVAQDLLACESSERLTVLRECYDRQTLQEATKLLSSQGNKEKVELLRAWIKESGLTGSDWDVYQETGFTPDELAEVERQAKQSDNPETQQPKTAPIRKELKVGSWTALKDGSYGCVEFIDRSKNEYWVKVVSFGVEKVKEPYTAKVPFESIKK